MSETNEPDFREPVHPDPSVQAERDVAIVAKANRRCEPVPANEQMLLFPEAA